MYEFHSLLDVVVVAASRDGSPEDLALIAVAMIHRSQELAHHSLAHALVRPEALIAECLLLVANIVRARGAHFVQMVLKYLRDYHFLFLAELGRFAEQAVPVGHGDITLLVILDLPLIASQVVGLLVLSRHEHL